MRNSMSKHQLEHYKLMLLEDQKSLQEQQNSKTDPTDISSQSNMDAELSLYDNHPADQATDLYEQEKEIAIGQGQLRQLDQIEHALQKILNNTYGYCEVCQVMIEPERLEAIPETNYCQEHAEQFHRHGEQYEYEPISTRQLNKDNNDYTGFDGEDMSQTLMEYSNSSEAQMSPMLDSEFAEELMDENIGYVEPLESFIATDITGKNVHIVRNAAYMRYIRNHEGDDELELL